MGYITLIVSGKYMSLKFTCGNCKQEIIVQFLKPGETALCKSCGTNNIVPLDAKVTDEKPDLSPQRLSDEIYFPTDERAEIKSELGPRDIGSIIGDSIRIYSKNFWKLLGICSVVQIPLAIFFYASQFLNIETASISYNLTAYLFFMLVIFFWSFVLHPLMFASFQCAITGYFLNRNMGIFNYYSLAINRLGTIIGSVLLVMLFIFLMIISVIGIPFSIYFGVGWIFIVNVALLEQRDIRKTLKRSRQLVEGNWWRVFGIYFCLILITAPITLMTLFLPQWISTLINIIITPFSLIGTLLIYFDLRVRKEQYSIEKLKEEFTALKALADE